ncbi:MAG: CsgG/HfaB family protein [Planctomycetota bacterium]
MKRMVMFLALAVCTGCGGAARSNVQINPRFEAYQIHRVAVLPFEGVPAEREIVDHGWWFEGHHFNNGELVSDMLSTEMMAIPSFEFLERSQIQKILQEKDLSMTNLAAEKSSAEIGQLLGVDAIVMGKVTKFLRTWSPPLHYGYGLCFSARMVDTKTGTVLWSAMVDRGGGGLDVVGAAREECAGIARELKARLSHGPATGTK